MTGPSAADRPENRADRAELALGLEEVGGDLDRGVGIEPVQHEAAVAQLAAAVILREDEQLPSSVRLGPQHEPAANPGIPDGLAVRADGPAAECHAPSQGEIDLVVGPAGLQVDGAIGVRVEPVAGRAAAAYMAPSPPNSRST